LSAKILLVTALDETHRKPLLESEGYRVTTVSPHDAGERLKSGEYQLVLLVKEAGSEETITFCEKVKQRSPHVKIAVIAQRAEYVPTIGLIDTVIRQQHSPRMFLSAVRKLLSVPDGDRFLSATEGK